ncbi:MAG: hypothetical protein WC454_09010 [Phycisphaerae bacterium]|jgi:hypothetical protein
MEKEKIVKAVVTFPISVKGVRKEPGEVIEGPESLINPIVGIKRATFDLAWKPVKAEKKEAKK